VAAARGAIFNLGGGRDSKESGEDVLGKWGGVNSI
jgi:hypothetical protein